MHKHVVFLVVLIFISLFPVSSVFSQTESSTLGLTVRPAIQDIVAEPGKQYKSTLNVINDSDNPVPVTIEAQTLIPIEDELDFERRSEFDASSWFEISKSDQILEPGEITPLDVTISVPVDANPGGHYAQVAIKVLAEATALFSDQTQVIPEVAASYFVTVPGDIVEQAELDTSNLIDSYVVKGSETPMSFYIKNTGNVHLLPSPKIRILNNGEVVDEILFQPQLILPNTQKEFSVDWKADQSYGTYEARVEFVYGAASIPLVSEPDQFRIGPAIYQLVGLVLLAGIAVFLLVSRKNIPNAIKAIKGQATNNSRKFKKRKDIVNVDKDVSDYQAIAEFLGSSAANDKKTLKPFEPLPPPPEKEKSSAKPIEEPDNKETIEAAVEKQPKQPLEELPVSKEASVTEFNDSGDKDNKTVIIQTSGTTIIRQESKTTANNKEEAKPEPKPKPKAKSKKKSIKITHVSEEKKPKKKTQSKAKKAPVKKKAAKKKTKTSSSKTTKKTKSTSVKSKKTKK